MTGAAGSIGSELCRQIVALGPKQLVLIEIDETRLYELWLELEGMRPGISVSCICDIRDREQARRGHGEYQPEVVLHAAAYKHVPLMELAPDEAVKTNVLGTLQRHPGVRAYGAERFVLISTDKAVAPANVMGLTKSLAERVMLDASRRGKLLAVAVRFGNVLAQPRQRRAHLRGAAAARRPAHRHRPRRHPLLHDHPGGRAPRAAGAGDRRDRRHLRARDGRAGQDRRPRPQDDRAVRRARRHRVRRPRARARSCTRCSCTSTEDLVPHICPKILRANSLPLLPYRFGQDVQRLIDCSEANDKVCIADLLESLGPTNGDAGGNGRDSLGD